MTSQMDTGSLAEGRRRAEASSGWREVYLVMPTMVKTFWKWGVRPKVWIFWPRLAAAIIIWMTRAMPLELRYSTLEKSRMMRGDALGEAFVGAEDGGLGGAGDVAG